MVRNLTTTARRVGLAVAWVSLLAACDEPAHPDPRTRPRVVRSTLVTAGDRSGSKPAAAPDMGWLQGDLPTAVARLEAAMIRHALAASGGNRAEAARRLGIHRQLLHEKLKRYGIETDEASGNRTA